MPQWKIAKGIIYYGDKIFQGNPKRIFEKYGADYPRIRQMKDLIDIFNRNHWVPNPSDLPPDA